MGDLMGRKPLDNVHIEELLNFAKRQGFDGFSRAEALNAGAVADNRWALLRDRTMKSGMIIKRGWKKSARYFHFEFSEKPEELPFLTKEEEDYEIDDVDEDFDVMDAPFKINGGVKNYRKEEVEATEEIDEFDDDDIDDVDDEESEIDDNSDDDELEAIINSLQDDTDQPIDNDSGWDFDF